MHLLIDVGNTRIKWRLVNSTYDSSESSQCGLLEDLADYIKTVSTDNVDVLLAAVNQTKALKLLMAESNFKSVTEVKSKSVQAGLKNSYQFPERMGVDRWLAIIAGYSAAKQGNHDLSGVIIIDAGSALTIDVVNAAGEHLGGYIVPGLIMAQQALFANTEQVIQYNDVITDSHQSGDYIKLGNNTNQCVENGVVNQMIALVNHVKVEYSEYELFFTGGDGEMLAGFFKAGTVDKDLVLKGLWQVRN